MPNTEQSILNKIEWAKTNPSFPPEARKARLEKLYAELEAYRNPQGLAPKEPPPPFEGTAQDALDEVLRRLACGECLSEICKTSGLPDAKDIRIRALEDKPKGFSALYEKARQLGYDAMAEEVLMTTSAPAARGLDLRAFLEARRWYLSKMAPTKYGEKAQPEAGPQTTVPAKIVIEVVQTPKMLEPAKVTNAVP